MTIRNYFQAQALLEGLVLGGMEHDKVFVAVRQNQELRDVMGNLSNKEFMDRIEKVASDYANRLKEGNQRGPLVKRHIELQSLTGALVGDTLALLGDLPSGNPRDVRDTVELMGRFESLQSSTQAEKLFKQAFDHLEEAGLDTAALEEKFNVLFPPIPVEPEEVKPEGTPAQP